jgi:16S rRNA (guanine966-N2)-methyltransferase
MARERQQRRAKSSLPATTLRIIGGRLRGSSIEYHGDRRTRPMKDRIREAAFNLLGPRVVGTHVIDLFAGTGALAFEALSRGAVSALLIERHFPTARLIERNANSLGVSQRVRVFAGDTFVWARTEIEAATGTADRLVVFCSPPYDLYVTRTQDMLDLIQTVVRHANSGSVMIVESDSRFQADQLTRDCDWDIRHYAPAVLAIGHVCDGKAD